MVLPVIEKRKHGIIPESISAQFSGAFPFAFECPVDLITVCERLTRLSNTQPRSNVDTFWISAEKRRFHIASRAFRTHIIEADGYLTAMSANITQVSGEIYGDYSPALAIRVIAMAIIGVFILLLMTGSLLPILAGAAAIVATGVYYRGSLRRTREDQVQLAQMIEEVLF
jgi:hypothetical protein